MKLLDLPTELIDLIAENLESNADLNALGRTSHRLHQILDPRLYSQDAKQSCEALRWGASAGMISAVKKSLEHGADANYLPSWDSISPLAMASDGGHIDIVELLLAHGANPNRSTAGDDSPLLLAIKKGHQGVAKVLLEKGGANMHVVDGWGQTPLLLSVEGRQDDTVKLLLKSGVLADDPGGLRGLGALEMAIKRRHISTIKLLLRMGVDPAGREGKGRNGAMMAAEAGLEGMAVRMVNKGVSPEAKDAGGRTLLWYALRWRCERLARFLLDQGLDIHSDGWTPLTAAILGGSIRLIELLLDRGAQLEYEDAIRRTPLRIAFESGQRDVVRVLRQRGASLQKARLDRAQMGLMLKFLDMSLEES
ncbi:hypothetical protein ACJZ2D_014597 [Fusarium nematophilum]